MIIGFTGKARNGKSTASEFAKEILGNNVDRINMKDGLVMEMIQNFPDLLKEIGKKENMLLDELFQLKPPLMRALMINYGTEVRRKDHHDYWVEKWKESALASEEDHIICDDLRFLNEAEAVSELDGIIIRIIRPGFASSSSNHTSETEMDKIVADYEIVNDGDINELHIKIEQTLQWK